MTDDSKPDQNLLLFSIGPVQDFIAAARTTRDLWSGSYLLSTLAAAALQKVKESGGKVIFPHIKNQPLFDGQPTFSTDKKQNEKNQIAFLTPTLPNRFLALIPPDVDPSDFEDAARTKLEKIVQDVTDGFPKSKRNDITFDAERFKKQAARLLEVQWQTIDITDPEKIRRLAAQVPKPKENQTQKTDSVWGQQNALIAWLLDGNKSLRQFDAWGTGEWKSGKEYLKDQLNGKEETVFTVSPASKHFNETQLDKLISDLKLNQGALKFGETLGASSVIKRFWGNSYLTKEIENLPHDEHRLRKAHPMPNTHDIANYNNKTESSNNTNSQEDKYFAIIAMDGDQMGQWISGAKFDHAITEDDHADFSEILNDFSVNHAAGIVEDSDGKLIYSGGDDVLAMVPAGNAIDCAKDLRDAFIKCFHGENSESANAKKYKSINASAGIAIAHFKSPLQDVVRAAQAAEKRAKRDPKDGGHGRAALAVTLFKRSGEILEWGGKWDGQGNKLLQKLKADLKNPKGLNARFPHKLEAQLSPYLSASESIQSDEHFDTNFPDILELEVQHTLSRNAGDTLGETDLKDFTAHWNELKELGGSFSKKLTLFINLLRTAAWLVRGEPKAKH